MTREDWKQMLPIVKSWTEGKELQIQVDGEWMTASDSLVFDMPLKYYKIKPEPREFWIEKTTLSCYKFLPDPFNPSDFIHVREVLDK